MLYDSAVNTAASYWGGQYGVTVDPALIQAIIQTESSHASVLTTAEPGGHTSYGPMMVLDDTAAAMGVDDPTELANDPSVGIWYGTQWFASLLEKFSGDVDRAISAYNAGSGNAVRSAAGTFPNQSYVNKVKGFWNQYRVTAIAAAPVVAIGLLLLIGYLARRRRRAA